MCSLASSAVLARRFILAGLVGSLLIVSAGEAPAATIAFFDNDTYGDTDQETLLLANSLTALGHTLNSFSGIAAADWEAATAGADLLVIPELDNGDLFADLTPAAQAAIASYINGGGGLIMFDRTTSAPRTIDFLNGIFGYALQPGFISNTQLLNAAAAAGTAFEGGPPTLPSSNATEGLTTANLPAGSLSLYEEGAATSVFVVDQGSGRIAFLGFDWFEQPTPALWEDVLGRAVDHVTAAPAADRTLIIKQGACPAPVNPDSNGFTTMLLVGDVDFDVSQVVLASLELSRCDGAGGTVAPHMGPPGPAPQIVDLSHPNDDDVGCNDGQVPCACNTDQSSDGIDDLRLRFNTDEMADAFSLDADAGAVFTLFLTGMLNDGSAFIAADCIRVVGSPVPPGALAVESNLPDVWINVTPLDNILDGGGFTPFQRAYPEGTLVTLTAPVLHGEWIFAGWLVNGDEYPYLVPTVVIEVEESVTISPLFVHPYVRQAPHGVGQAY